MRRREVSQTMLPFHLTSGEELDVQVSLRLRKIDSQPSGAYFHPFDLRIRVRSVAIAIIKQYVT